MTEILIVYTLLAIRLVHVKKIIIKKKTIIYGLINMQALLS